jgi:Sulfocyanin (SoxE) domain
MKHFTPLSLALILGALPGCAGRARNSNPVLPAAAAPATASDTVAVRTSQPADSVPGTNWWQGDSAKRTLSLTLEVTSRAGAPSALINGYRAGKARVVVPVGWTVQWNWRNSDVSPHSLLVMVQREKIPPEGGRPSFSNAMTRMVTEGLAPGEVDRTTFQAEEAGWYWLMCGVPGHALKGEWIELRVDPAATTARVEAH